MDATILSYLYDERTSLRAFVKATCDWWRVERPRYGVYVSEVTLAELDAGDYPRKGEVIAAAVAVELLPPNESILEIAQTYLAHKLMPQQLRGDALHLAYASFYRIDFLLTWNCRHLANANKRQHIRWVNTLLSLATPEIITPLELVTEQDYAD